jgi:hypothetical protein
MPLENRTWKPNGYDLIGQASDGRRAVQVNIDYIGYGKDPTPDERRDLAVKLAALANQYGGPRLTETQDRILEAVTEIVGTGWPATAPKVADRTGLSVAWVREVLEQLVDLNMLEQAESGHPRVFRIPALERADL